MHNLTLTTGDLSSWAVRFTQTLFYRNRLAKRRLKYFHILMYIVVGLLLNQHLLAAPDLDSLQQQLKTTAQDTNRVNLLIDLAYGYKYDSIDVGMNCVQEAITLAQKLGSHALLIEAYLCQGRLYDYQGDNLKSESVALKGLNLARKIESDRWIALMTNHLGTSLWAQYKMPEALEYFHESLKYSEKINDVSQILLCYHYIGWVYHQLLIFDKTLTYYNKGIDLAFEVGDTAEVLGLQFDKAWVYYQQEKYPKALAEFWAMRSLALQSENMVENIRALSMLGEVYVTMENVDSALYYLRLTETLSFQEEQWFELGASYEWLGEVYAKLKNDSASYYYEKAIALTEEKGSPTSLAFTQLSLGEFWLDQKNYSKSLHYLQQAEAFFKQSNDNKRLSDIFSILGEVYYQQGKNKMAYEILNQAQQLKDSIYNEGNKELREEIETRYEIRKKEEQIALLNEKNVLKQQKLQQQRLLLISIAAILILVIGLAVASYYAYRQKQKANHLLEDQNEEIRQQHAATEKAKQYIEEHAERLKELDSLKTRFFANISHELRTPLTLVLGPLQRLIQQHNHSEATQKDLRLMERNSNKLLGLVEEILDMSKLEAQKLQLQEQVTHLSSFVRRVYANFESQASYLNIQYNLIEQVPEDFHGMLDQNRVEKILNNLLSNAMKFTPKGEMIMVSSQLEEGKLQLMIKDTGEGINPKDLPHVFERFFQTKQSHTKIVGGTGIGLALSKELAELMGGELTVSSTVGKGSAFTLIIPVSKAPKPSLENHAEPITELNEILPMTRESVNLKKEYRLLIVEDNMDMQRYIISLIENEYHYTVANDGQEAVAILEKQEQPIDLILSDVMMSRMDGFELLSYVKTSPAFRNLPFIVLTARAAQEDKLNALTIGVDDYLIKPFFQNELLVRVQNLLSNYQARQEWQEVVDVPHDTEEEPDHVHELSNDAAISDADQNWIEKVETEIRGSVHKVDYSITSLADHMNVSTRQFQRKLKKVTGLTPVKYQQEIRLQIAREHLETGEHSSVKEIAYSVGFQKVSYFSKLYLERFGRRPSDYLK